jgi:hypothetical protein
VDFLPAAAQSDEARAAAAAVRAADRRATRTATAIVDGVARQFTVSYPLKHNTNGGCLMDAVMMYDHMVGPMPPAPLPAQRGPSLVLGAGNLLPRPGVMDPATAAPAALPACPPCRMGSCSQQSHHRDMVRP